MTSGMLVISPDGKVTTGPKPAAPPWEYRQQALVGISEDVLADALGPKDNLIGGWLAWTPAGQAMITPADGLPAWEVSGPDGILPAIAALIFAATGGRRRYCGWPVRPYGAGPGAPMRACGRRFLHNGPHRSRQAVRRALQRAADRRRQGR